MGTAWVSSENQVITWDIKDLNSNLFIYFTFL